MSVSMISMDLRRSSIELYKALHVNDIGATLFTGSVSPAKRPSLLAEWRSSPVKRVLLMSRVGSVGLNLTEASIVIHYVSRAVSFCLGGVTLPL